MKEDEKSQSSDWLFYHHNSYSTALTGFVLLYSALLFVAGAASALVVAGLGAVVAVGVAFGAGADATGALGVVALTSAGFTCSVFALALV